MTTLPVTPATPSTPEPPKSADSTFLAVQYDPEKCEPAYFVVAAPDERRARQIALAAVGTGRLLVDLLTPAVMQTLLDRALTHPADHP